MRWIGVKTVITHRSCEQHLSKWMVEIRQLCTGAENKLCIFILIYFPL